MSSAGPSNIHRYLDEVFAGIAMTPDTQDLKEEIRGNLAARVAELEATGARPDAAVASAIAELGDIRQLVDSIEDSAPTPGTAAAAARLAQLNRVRISAAYVVRTVLLSLVLAAGIALIVTGVALGAAGSAPGWFTGILPVLSALSGAFAGLIVGDALVRETTTHHPMPARRAAGFGAASFIGFSGLGLIADYLGDSSSLWQLIAGIVLALASLMAFIALGVTQSNRTKPWAREMQRGYALEDRFSQDPAAAARFGIYTVVIWVLAIAAFVVLSITVGFAWSWLAIIAALVVFFLILARMLFPADRKDRR